MGDEEACAARLTAAPSRMASDGEVSLLGPAALSSLHRTLSEHLMALGRRSAAQASDDRARRADADVGASALERGEAGGDYEAHALLDVLRGLGGAPEGEHAA